MEPSPTYLHFALPQTLLYHTERVASKKTIDKRNTTPIPHSWAGKGGSPKSLFVDLLMIGTKKQKY